VSLYPALVNGAHVERFLTDRGVVLSQAGRACFLSAALQLFPDALETLKRRAAGDWSPDKRLEMLPPSQPIGTLKGTHGPTKEPKALSSAAALFKAYCLDKKPAPTTVSRWRVVFTTLNASQEPVMDPEAAQRWLDGLKTEDRSARTVRDIWLSAARTVYAWAKRKRLVAVNPFEDCVVEVPRKAERREDGKTFSNTEASIILQAAVQVEVRPGQPWDAARRWVPWLCAYTGARVGEVTQLRAQDIDDVRKTVRITPEAGTVKTGRTLQQLYSGLSVRQRMICRSTRASTNCGIPEASQGWSPIARKAARSNSNGNCRVGLSNADASRHHDAQEHDEKAIIALHRCPYAAAWHPRSVYPCFRVRWSCHGAAARYRSIC
jgi:hypothetical protein